MDEGDEARSLRRIAARLLNRNENEGLEELNRITAGIYKKISRRFTLCATAFCFFALLFAVALIAWMAAELAGHSWGYSGLAIPILFGAAALAPLLHWRNFQYGLGADSLPKAAIYADANKASAEMLEKVFAYLRRETSPRGYVYGANNIKRYRDRRHFSASLRGLLLSKDDGIRAGCLPPYGLWFSRMIHIDADADDIIKAIKAKPKAGGRKKEFDYATMLLRLIDHPALAAIEPGKHGCQAQLMNLIRSLCDPNDEDETGIAVPEETTLRQFAKEIEAALPKNRAGKK
jgi:hypothetical protein